MRVAILLALLALSCSYNYDELNGIGSGGTGGSAVAGGHGGTVNGGGGGGVGGSAPGVGGKAQGGSGGGVLIGTGGSPSGTGGTGASAAGGSGGGTAGSAGTGGAPSNIVLTPTDTGAVQNAASGVHGGWYAYGDGVGPNPNNLTTDSMNSVCELNGRFPATDCSQINAPIPGRSFMPNEAGAMCTTGMVARVLPGPDGNPDYADLWGAGIALDLNNPNLEPGTGGYFDMAPYTGISFDFTGAMVPDSYMRVNFPFMGEHGNDSPYWDGATMGYSPLMATLGGSVQHVTIHWADIGGPMYLTQQTPAVDPSQYPFNKNAVQAIQFVVFTNTTTPMAYSYCVNNLTLLTQ